MNFIRLQGLAAGTVSGRNNGLATGQWNLIYEQKTKFHVQKS